MCFNFEVCSQPRMWMSTENLIRWLSLFILHLFLIQTSQCMNPPHNCISSSCGIIHNISFPFRLKDDPKHCGYPDYELECENNVTRVLHLNSQKYQVKSINYNNFTIRLADVSINNTNICSFPNSSLYSRFLNSYPYSPFINDVTINSSEIAWPINFMRCPYTLKNSSLFTQLATNCPDSTSYQTYIMVGHMNASYVQDMCRVDPIVLTCWKFEDIKNASVSEIHQSLVFGFELSWQLYPCTQCGSGFVCVSDNNNSYTCEENPDLWDSYKRAIIRGYFERLGHPRGAPIVILMLIVVILLAAIILPARIIIVLACALGILIFAKKRGFFRIVFWILDHPLPLIGKIPGLFFAVRFIIVLACIMWFLMYKFRRRHLSRYDVIEDYLQSDNHLTPIRYSYSDIKTMTRGFQEKLGEGGYGTVYKGKLRSGYDVAVKLLRKSGGDDQNFMNEIATIGRIHHVNVVNLVGYCAERSKRALVFDFMPNGSLDKFIIGRENVNSLTWERKYEIAVGVARGIEYLHRGCNIQILHFDIKPHNILLDDKFIPKISDFGLAKFCSTEKNSVTLTAARGTIGYVAPELINRGFGGVSYKADVYSFGMMLMDMVGLKRDLVRSEDNSSQYFPYWIYDYFEQGKDIEYNKPDEINDDDNDSTREIAKKMTIVALCCIEMSPNDRPSMNKVVEMLEGQVESLRVPNQPSQSAHGAVNFEDQSWTTYSTNSTSLLLPVEDENLEIRMGDILLYSFN